MTRPIALVGLSGAGKSAVAPRLAARRGGTHVDLDEWIAAASGASVADLFAARGEPEFRRLEIAALERAIASAPAVIACGGGVVETEACRVLLRDRCDVVWLQVTPPTAARRVGAGDGAVRPLLDGGAEPSLVRLLERRAVHYATVARARVETEGQTVDAVADAILAALESAEP